MSKVQRSPEEEVINISEWKVLEDTQEMMMFELCLKNS